jgi:hypothetical protein
VVVWVRAPEVPVTVIVDWPTAAAPLAVKVNVLGPVVGFGANVAVTPAGSPEAESVTLPGNPYWLFTYTVAAVDVPWPRLTEPKLDSVKVGA